MPSSVASGNPYIGADTENDTNLGTINNKRFRQTQLVY
jgi:hypothetical protein